MAAAPSRPAPPPPPPGPPAPPRGAAASAPAGEGRPALPKVLMFSGKNIKAVAVGDAVTFGRSEAGNVQLGVPFRVLAGQRVRLYAVPDGWDGPPPGEMVALPEDVHVTFIKAMTPDAAPFGIDALRNAGWQGDSLGALKRGRPDGLGGTPEAPVVAHLTVSIEEKDNRTSAWRVDKEGRFRPRMVVEWVNKAGGFAFSNEAEDAEVAALDRELAALLRSGARKAAPAAPKAAPAKPAEKAAAAEKAASPGKASPASQVPSPRDIPEDRGDEDQVGGDDDPGEDDIPF